MKPLRAFYERVAQTSHSAPRIEIQLAQLDAIPRPADRTLRVLDMGCGDGYLAARAARSPRAQLVAVDLSYEALVVSRRRGLLVGQASVDDGGLPFRAGAFDVVMMSEVIEHLVDPDLALEEAWRVLTPGGTLLLSTPNMAAWFNRTLLAVGVQPIFSEVSRLGIFGRPGKVVVGHLRLFTSRALLQLLEFHGFEVVTLAGAGFHEVPRGVRWLDRYVARWPSLAAILVAQFRRLPTRVSSSGQAAGTGDDVLGAPEGPATAVPWPNGGGRASVPSGA